MWAKGYGDSFIECLYEHIAELTPFGETELSVCRSMFLDYCVLGGMPAVVSDYITKGTFEGSLETQRQLIADYKEDIRKYAEGIDQTPNTERVQPNYSAACEREQKVSDFKGGFGGAVQGLSRVHRMAC